MFVILYFKNWGSYAESYINPHSVLNLGVTPYLFPKTACASCLSRP